MPCIMKYLLVPVLGVMFQIILCVLMKSHLGCLNPRNLVVFVLNPCLNTKGPISRAHAFFIKFKILLLCVLTVRTNGQIRTDVEITGYDIHA